MNVSEGHGVHVQEVEEIPIGTEHVEHAPQLQKS